MAWTLTTARSIALFEALDVPYYTGHYTMDGMGALSSQTSLSGTAAQAKTQIESYLSAATSGSGDTELFTYLDRWIAIGTTVAVMEGGSVDGVQGISHNYENEREILRGRIRILVPFYQQHLVLQRRNQTGGLSVPIMR